MKANGKHETSPSGLRAARRDNVVAAAFAGLQPATNKPTGRERMTRKEVLEILNSIRINATADRWTRGLIEMPNGCFYDAEDFRIRPHYWQDGERIESPVLEYAGDVETNSVFWPMTA